MTLLLTRADVADLLDLEQAMACIEQAHREQGEGLVTPYPRAIIRSGESYLRVLPGALAGIGRMGTRFSSHGANAVAGLLLFDTRDGRLLSLMDRSSLASSAIRRSVLCIHSACGEPHASRWIACGSRSTRRCAAG